MDRIPQIKQTRNMMIMIPDDVLLSNVFIRLAAKQVAQMRSLSKTWNSLLSHPSFIQSHLDYYPKHEILMVFGDCYFQGRIFTEDTFISQTGDFRVNPISRFDYFVAGSVHGLICLFGHRGVKIWNPSLSALKYLPFPPYITGNGYEDCNGDFRFGFDPKANDYKVVLLTFYFNDDGDDDMTNSLLTVQVLSLRKGDWVSITERFPSNLRRARWIPDSNHVFVDGDDGGRLHYLCANGDNKVATIVAFDLGDETFSEIALPADCVYRENELGFLSKKLCVMSCVANGGCEVWVMENYGWAKRHVISKYDDQDIVPVGFTKNNLFLFRHGNRLSLYDTEASTYRRLKGAPLEHYYCYGTIKVVQYVDSLVWGNIIDCITSLKEATLTLLDG